MSRISATMAQHHRHCDEEFAAAEEAVRRRDWSAAQGAFAAFGGDLETHLGAEESVLFPAFERSTGMAGGPTQVMRHEHRQMRGLLEQMRQALAGRDADGFAGAAETLLILMQQHNMKEENILYPMCDQALGSDADLCRELERAILAQVA